ncbi:MAG: 16S rRNA (guanine(527)-N(7))-methyltransferase RsmG [Rickettsiaceae bacterium]|nr:16S rRNA (guanine(527)-N(7))-methyltransferase RsmG [Rickettsiaceae bacterium]
MLIDQPNLSSNPSLRSYVELLLKWNKAINLISKSTEETVWQRHIYDSLQLLEFIDLNQSIVDVGTGAGLPGVVLSIAGVQKTYLIESDTRKCAFLEVAKKFSNNKIIIINKRAEHLQNQEIDLNSILVSRAMAKITILLDLKKRIGLTGPLLILKGENYAQELQQAFKFWDFDYNISASKTNNLSVILRIQNERQKS